MPGIQEEVEVLRGELKSLREYVDQVVGNSEGIASEVGARFDAVEVPLRELLSADLDRRLKLLETTGFEGSEDDAIETG